MDLCSLGPTSSRQLIKQSQAIESLRRGRNSLTSSMSTSGEEKASRKTPRYIRSARKCPGNDHTFHTALTLRIFLLIMANSAK